MRANLEIALTIALCFLATAAQGRTVEKKKQPPHAPPDMTPDDLAPQAKTAAPVDCFKQAKLRTFLNDEQSTRLCHCQHSARNVDCFLDAKRATFLNDEQAMRLCSGGRFSDLNCLD